MYPGLGWGDQIPIRTGTQLNHPLGLETGAPTGGLGGVELIPLVYMNDVVEFQPAAPYRRVSLNSTDCIILRDRIDRIKTYTKDEKTGRTHTATPQSEYLCGDVVATAFRCPSTFLMTIEAQLEAKKDFEINPKKNNYMFMIPYGGFAQNYHSIVSKQRGESTQVVDYKVPQHFEFNEPGFVSVIDNPFGTGAIFNFVPTCVDIKRYSKYPRLYAFPILKANHLKKGQKIHSKYLLVLTQGDDGNPVDIFEKVYDNYGFDGTLGSKIAMHAGTVLDEVFSPEFEAADYGIRATFSKTDIPAGLGLKVYGLCPNWDVSLYDIDAGELDRNVSMDEAVAYVNLDVSRQRNIFVGNLLNSDREDIFINVFEASVQELRFAVHNPTDEMVKATIRTVGGVDIPPVVETVELSPGQTKHFEKSR